MAASDRWLAGIDREKAERLFEAAVAEVAAAGQPRPVGNDPGETGGHRLAVHVARGQAVGQQPRDRFVEVSGGEHQALAAR